MSLHDDRAIDTDDSAHQEYMRRYKEYKDKEEASIRKVKESMPPQEELEKLREALQHAMELAEQYKEKLVRPASIVRIESDKDYSWVDWDETTPHIQLDQRISDVKDLVTDMAIIIGNTLDRMRDIEDDIEIIPGHIYPGWDDAD